MQANIYDTITSTILRELETGRLSWRKRWITNGLPLRWNGVPYRGINTLVLWATAENKGYNSPFWLTYNQAKALNGPVQRGEKGTWIIYYNTVLKKGATEDEDMTRRVLRAYVVFNAEQCGQAVLDIASKRMPAPLPDAARIENAETYFRLVGADLRHGGDRAYYNIADDYIQMPLFGQFKDSLLYYATLAHEHVHWTQHSSRLDRSFGRQRYGDEGYAMEELVAEIGAAFLSAKLGIPVDARADHAAYIQSWLTVLKEHNKAIITAAAAAQKAVEFMDMRQPNIAEMVMEETIDDRC